jgi:hypothetical protein
LKDKLTSQTINSSSKWKKIDPLEALGIASKKNKVHLHVDQLRKVTTAKENDFQHITIV